MKKRNLKILAISDTHLGEDCSILSFPHGRQHLWKKLRESFGGAGKNDNGEKFEIDELILIGDIPDRTLSSTSQIITHTNAFMRTLSSVANVKKCIFVPGNHDHTLWSDFINAKEKAKGKKFDITKPSGEVLVEGGVLKYSEKIIGNILSIFFGHPYGSLWRAIEKNEKNKGFEFVIANPIYSTKVGERTYAFAHGTHFKPIVCWPTENKKILSDLAYTSKILKDRIELGKDPREAGSILDYEDRIHRFVDTLWPSSKNNPTSRSDQFYYFLASASEKHGHKREHPEKSRLFKWSEVTSDRSGRFLELVEKLNKKSETKKEDEQIKLLRKFFLRRVIEFLRKGNKDLGKLTFVYGDSHTGGWSEFPYTVGDIETDVRVFNAGGWVIHNKGNHPPCHIFAVDRDSNEELVLDISYKSLKVGGDDLLELASEDVENKNRMGNKALTKLFNSAVRIKRIWDKFKRKIGNIFRRL